MKECVEKGKGNRYEKGPVCFLPFCCLAKQVYLSFSLLPASYCFNEVRGWNFKRDVKTGQNEWVSQWNASSSLSLLSLSLIFIIITIPIMMLDIHARHGNPVSFLRFVLLPKNDWRKREWVAYEKLATGTGRGRERREIQRQLLSQAGEEGGGGREDFVSLLFNVVKVCKQR